jgi:carboxyl-terminal processing protease
MFVAFTTALLLASAPLEPAKSSEQVSVEELTRFAEVFREVQASFVEPVSDHVLMEAAIHGLLTRLDPHSEYLARADLEAFSDETAGVYGGLGVEVQVESGALKIVSPMDDTPAARAGLRSGDVISRIDGAVIEGEAAFTGVELLRGDVGSSIKLEIQRAGAEPFEVSLKREVIQVKSARAERLPGGMAWLRVAAFQNDTVRSAERALKTLQDKKLLRGLVLDLRSNPGGFVTSAVGLADMFLESGVIVSTKGRQDSANTEMKATAGDLLKGAPMVVLIDAGSASAAEIVAGALQDQHRAIIVGQKSFGKGSVQSLLPLSNGDGLRLTTARYYTPNGTSIQARGIWPDVPLDNMALTRVQASVSEADLARHLNQAEAPAQNPEERPLPPIESDYALSEAVNVLRAVALLRERDAASAGKKGAN